MLMARNRILIVDDEPAVRFGIREFLELHGYQIAEAARTPGIFSALPDQTSSSLITCCPMVPRWIYFNL
jgi:CheY-like chemotaxis protein